MLKSVGTGARGGSKGIRGEPITAVFWRLAGFRWMILLSISLLGMCALVWIEFAVPTEPSYDGRTVSQWFFCWDYGGRTNQEVECAFAVMGKAAIPALKRYLRPDSRLDRVVSKLMPPRILSRWVRRQNPVRTRLNALAIIRGPLISEAHSVTPELLALANDSKDYYLVRMEALGILSRVATNLVSIQPCLAKAMNDPDPSVRAVVPSCYATVRRRLEKAAEARMWLALTNTLPRKTNPLPTSLFAAPQSPFGYTLSPVKGQKEGITSNRLGDISIFRRER